MRRKKKENREKNKFDLTVVSMWLAMDARADARSAAAAVRR
jgi:hypothetical protein